MFLVYTPDEGDEQRYFYNPNKLMSPEMEAIERVTDRNWTVFTADVVQGNALCRRALLWVMQKRVHPTLKFGDVSMSWEQVKLEYSREELMSMIESVRDSGAGAQQAVAIEQLERDLIDAVSEDETGKARSPIAE